MDPVATAPAHGFSMGKDRAAELIGKCGGRFINFFGRLNIQRIAR